MYVEILQSPWLCELTAFHINLREEDPNANTRKPSELFKGCYLKFTDEKPSLTCELFDSVKLDIDFTCSVCLVSTRFCPLAFMVLDFHLYLVAWIWNFTNIMA